MALPIEEVIQKLQELAITHPGIKVYTDDSDGRMFEVYQINVKERKSEQIILIE